MLRMENINKNLGSFAIKDVSLHIPKGYICGLIGENGAGKSSLIKTISGLYRQDSGRVFVDGMEFAEQEASIKDILGLVMEDQPFDDSLSAQAAAKLYRRFYAKFDETLYFEYLKRFQVPRDRKFRKLSKGMKIKFWLALALSHEARLFLFDEPTAGLDMEFRREFLAICTELVADGERSVLFSTHLTKDLDRVADYIAYMQDGRLLFMESKEALYDRFVYVQAENYKLRLIPQKAVVYKEEGSYGGNALVVNSRQVVLDGAYQKRRPTIEELMYCFVKGGSEHARNIVSEYL